MRVVCNAMERNTYATSDGSKNAHSPKNHIRKPFAKFDHEVALRMDFSKDDDKSEFSLNWPITNLHILLIL